MLRLATMIRAAAGAAMTTAMAAEFNVLTCCAPEIIQREGANLTKT